MAAAAAVAAAKAARLTDEQLFALGDQYDEARGKERKAKQDADDCASQIIGELDTRKVGELAGQEATLTVVRQASYNEAGLHAAVSEELREELFEEQIDFSILTAAEQRALLAYLSPGQRDQVIVRKIRDRKALQAAIAGGRIAQRTARRFTSYGKPSIRVSRGPSTRARRVH